MGKFCWFLLMVLCLLAVECKKKGKASDPPDEDGEEEGKLQNGEEGSKQDEGEDGGETPEEPEEEAEPAEGKDLGSMSDDEGSGSDDTKEFACNLKFKRVGCYADKSKKEKPLKSFIMSDADMGSMSKKGKLPSGDTFNVELPKFACKCANEALNSGNAIFGLQNIAECWTGPDSSKYDKDGASSDCVTFNYDACANESELCAGKKHANFVYYIDTPEHTKSAEEIEEELIENKKKKQQKKKGAAKKKSKKSKKKSKKSKKQ